MHVPDLLSAGEAGRILGLSAQRVADLCDEGKLRHIRASRGVRLMERADVEALAAVRAAARAAANGAAPAVAEPAEGA